MREKKWTVLLFWLTGFLLFWGLQQIFGASNYFSEHAEMMMNGYYEQEEDTLDVVLVGNSHIYKFWQGAFGWQEWGIASLAFSTSDMPFSVIKNMAQEALKTQSPGVLVLDATAFAVEEVTENNKIYLILNNMKLSANYFATVDSYCSSVGIYGLDRIAYYFPFFQFHSRWKELNIRDFSQTYPSYLNSCYLNDFLTKKVSKGTKHVYTQERLAIAGGAQQSLEDLLAWCKEQDEQMEILFIAAPLLVSEEEQARINYVGDLITEAGFSFLNFNTEEQFAAFEFKIRRDYQDLNHTNVNGSYKFTKVFGQYLIETYNVPDRRGTAGYEAWDVKAQQYMEVIDGYFRYG